MLVERDAGMRDAQELDKAGLANLSIGKPAKVFAGRTRVGFDVSGRTANLAAPMRSPIVMCKIGDFGMASTGRRA
jgi:hypothetical protein